MWRCPLCCDRSIIALLPGCVYWKNRRMVWIGREFKDHLVPTPLPWTGKSSARPGWSKPCPTWPWTLPEIEQGDRKHRSGFSSSLSLWNELKYFRPLGTVFLFFFFWPRPTTDESAAWDESCCGSRKAARLERDGGLRVESVDFVIVGFPSWRIYLRTDDVFL